MVIIISGWFLVLFLRTSSHRGILHDDSRYPNPETFDPTRFLDANGQLDPNAPDPTEASFGFGRRICPGRHFAMESLWITIAYMLATVKLEKPLDETGKVIEPSGEYTPGLIRWVPPTFAFQNTDNTYSYPVPFKASFKPRSPAAYDLIQSAILAD